MYLCLFEDDQVSHLNPLTYTRAVYDLRLGMRTLLEAARDTIPEAEIILHVRPFLALQTAHEHGLPVNHLHEDNADVLFLNGRWIAEQGAFLQRLNEATETSEARLFVQEDTLVAAWIPDASKHYLDSKTITRDTFADLPEDTLVESVEGIRLISRLWHLIDELRPALLRDFVDRVAQREDEEIPALHQSVLYINEDQIYRSPTAIIRPGALLNAESGPIFLDDHALVMERAVIRGPAYIGPHAHVKIAAQIEGCAIGPWSKVGGEVADSVFHSYSNKAHAGFLGHSYLGRWCNIAADSNTSNLKNDYGPVSLFNAATGAFESSQRQFLGLMMGDHSKCGINTMFNTGTVVGVFCNLYGAGYLPRYVPSFSWGGPIGGFNEYRLDKAFLAAERMMARRNKHLTDAERTLLTKIFEETQRYRTFAA